MLCSTKHTKKITMKSKPVLIIQAKGNAEFDRTAVVNALQEILPEYEITGTESDIDLMSLADKKRAIGMLNLQPIEVVEILKDVFKELLEK
jgi:hypothetical protein